ncbi:sensor [Methylopila jiangsuensis]|uniref:Sensor n=1 Tax=Methylopila jiangsuensis TaxID=586230 RepID=A0A9W6JG00_9HYPH|nr:FecR domain-containing protein [Methylopila jiangsuensis]MDR6285968.1 transmembrane sensor [Methylopila jiangsuensis]GLK75726.1 sensor [Methylopila jiangsuensis]
MAELLRDDDGLWSEAFDLLLRLQADPDNPVARETAERWLARSADHRRVWGEAIRLHELGGEALAARSAPQPRVPSRRRVLAGGGAALAAGAAGAVVLPGAIVRARADVATGVAERRQVTLPDGCPAELGPETALRYDFSDTRRSVELLRGMAYFEPLPGAQAFVAIAAGVKASTASAAFEIREEAGVVTVGVERGLVEMPAAGRLGPGDWCAFGDDGRLQRGRTPVDRVAGWRQGLIFADSDTLASVAARVARWSAARVVIADATLGGERISGVFDPTAPLDALVAAVAPLGGSARPVTPWLVVLSRF